MDLRGGGIKTLPLNFFQTYFNELENINFLHSLWPRLSFLASPYQKFLDAELYIICQPGLTSSGPSPINIVILWFSDSGYGCCQLIHFWCLMLHMMVKVFAIKPQLNKQILLKLLLQNPKCWWSLFFFLFGPE